MFRHVLANADLTYASPNALEEISPCLRASPPNTNVQVHRILSILLWHPGSQGSSKPLDPALRVLFRPLPHDQGTWAPSETP